MSEKILVCFSGGADSTTLLYQARDWYGEDNVGTVYFYYNQRHASGERCAVATISDLLWIHTPELNIPLAQFGRSPLVDLTLKMPTQEEKQQAITVVPYRNTMFLVMAAAKATIEGYDEIMLGATYEDLAEYPDCRPEYFNAMKHALRLADRHHHLQICAPFVRDRKKDVIKRGLELKVPYELTWTCYLGKPGNPCHVCDACKEREQSFLDNGMIDPLVAK